MLTFSLFADSPKLNLDDLFPPPMTSDRLFPVGPPLPPPKEIIHYPNTRTVSVQSQRRRPSSDQSPVLRQAPHDRSQRIASPLSDPPELNTAGYLTSGLSNGDVSPGELLGTWSTAVGRATTGGKSGRVIERLMNDNDRLLREKKLATVKLEEEVKRGESARAALDSLELSNANLTSLHESDITLLGKRDRRIQQLRDDLKAERIKREAAEYETRETQRERDATINLLQRQAAEHKEKYLRAITQYEMLSGSWTSLEERYLKQTKALASDIAELRSDIETDKRRLAQMEIVMEQMAKESERSKKAKEKLLVEFETYKAEHENAVRSIRERAALNDDVNDQTQRQMLDLLGHMRYIVNVKQNVSFNNAA